MGLNIVIAGPGGVGKGTIVRRLLDELDGLWLSRSWTTRDRRPGEAADAYVFATTEEFAEHVAAGGFLEYVDFLDYRQGTPMPTPPADADAVFEIDVHGAKAIAEWDHDALLLFIDVPDPSDQHERLVGRGDEPHRVQQRMAKADEERALATQIGMTWVINDDLDGAVARVIALIEHAREVAKAQVAGDYRESEPDR